MVPKHLESECEPRKELGNHISPGIYEVYPESVVIERDVGREKIGTLSSGVNSATPGPSTMMIRNEMNEHATSSGSFIDIALLNSITERRTFVLCSTAWPVGSMVECMTTMLS